MTDICELLDRVRDELVAVECDNDALMRALDRQLEACRDGGDGDQWWTVLLLWPEHVTDDYGKDTYRTFVEAGTPVKALELARLEAVSKHVGDDDNYRDIGFPPEDMHLLSLVEGKAFSYDDGWGGVAEQERL